MFDINPAIPRERTEANARLIAAAPELLAALREVMAHVEFFNPDEPNYTAGDENECKPWKRARAAIAKAEGVS